LRPNSNYIDIFDEYGDIIKEEIKNISPDHDPGIYFERLYHDSFSPSPKIVSSENDIITFSECNFLDSSIEYRYGDVGIALPIEYVNKYNSIYKIDKNYGKSKSITIEDFITGKGECIVKENKLPINIMYDNHLLLISFTDTELDFIKDNLKEYYTYDQLLSLYNKFSYKWYVYKSNFYKLFSEISIKPFIPIKYNHLDKSYYKMVNEDIDL
jgi:hypothetical protein